MVKLKYLFILLSFQIGLLYAQNYPIGHTTITFNDATRTGGFGSGGGPGRQIQTEVYYPAVIAGNNTAIANGVFPIIVFGHGFAMAWDAYQNIWDDFASQGYILAFPRTEGSIIPVPNHDDFGLDLALVEVKMQALNTDVASLFYQKIKNKSAIIGHSMGGGATFLAAANNNSPTLKAVVGLAPAETNPSAINAAQNVSVDALILSGSSDGVTPPSSNHLPIYNNLASTCKTFLSIVNGSHCYFANSNFNCDFGELTTGTGSLSRAAQQDISSDYLSLWLDFQLKGSCLAWDEFLDSLAVSSRVVDQQSCSYGYLQPDVSISGNTSFCQGENTLLIASQNVNYNYTWYLNNFPLTGNSDSLTVNAAGSYFVSAVNSFNCIDSSPILILNSLPSYYIRDTTYACLGSSYSFPDGFTSIKDTTHISALISSQNCDSLIERSLIFGSSLVANIQIDLCSGNNFVINGVSYTSDTLVRDTLVNGSFFGCDSVNIYNIKTLIPDSTIKEAFICQGDNYQLPSGLFVNQEGLYPTTHTNQLGCDSVYAIDLSVGIPLPILTVQAFDYNGSTLGDTIFLVLQDNLSYDSLVWTTDNNCSLIYQSGDTAFFIITVLAQNYSIMMSVHQDACVSEQEININMVGLVARNNRDKLRLFPNPTGNYLQIESEDEIQNLWIFNSIGALILEMKVTEKKMRIDCTQFSPGLYFIKTAEGSTSFSKY